MRVLFLPLVALVLLSIGAGVLSRPAAGVGFTVDSTVDAVDANPGDGVCATEAGDCTLRAAIQETNALPGADETTVPAGTYLLTVAGVGEDAAATGDLDITDDLAITGAGQGATVFDGNGLDSVIHVIEGEAAELTHLSIQGGSNLTLEGGVYGGGIRNDGTLTLSQAAVTDNTALAGGGIFNSGQATLDEVLIGNNEGPVYGGGVANELNSTLLIVRSTVSGNRVETGDGGGIYNGGTAQISDSTVALNEASRNGGGLFNHAAEKASISNTTISGNAALRGGGIFNSGPVSDASGLPPLPGGEVQADNVTIANNAAQEAPILLNRGTVTIRNSILAGGDGGAECEGAVVSLGHNLSDDASCGLDAVGDLSGIDPLLGPLGDNGGPTQTHSLTSESPAIDAGDDAACPQTDQRGEPRPLDGDHNGTATCDIGAYEAPGEAASTPTSDPTPGPSPVVLPKTGGRP